MMSLWSQAVLLLFLSTLPPFNFNVFTKAASASPPVTRSRTLVITMGSEDYNEDYENQGVAPKVYVSARNPNIYQELCQYNPCLEDQPPCSVLLQQTGCLCPGMSRASQPPHAPRIQELQPVNEGPDRGKVEVKWCAPSSVVSGYRVMVEGNGQYLEFKDTLRKGIVGYLEVGTKVCVEAVNNVGHSSPSEFSCKRYDAPTSWDNNLMIGVLVGAVALILLIILAVIFWKYRTCQKTKRDSNDGLGNPSYSTGEGTL